MGGLIPSTSAWYFPSTRSHASGKNNRIHHSISIAYSTPISLATTSTNSLPALEHFSQFHNIFILVYSIMYNNPNAFTTAWDGYVTVHCRPYKNTAAKKYSSNFPACEAEDICMLCSLKWENTPNFNFKAHKCECCEMPDEDILIPELSIIRGWGYKSHS